MTSLARRNPILRMLTALVATAVCLVATSGPANAKVYWENMVDHFDDNAASRWRVSSTGDGLAGFGNGQASISHSLASGWTEISRDVTVPWAGQHECFAGISLRNLLTGVAVVNIEVIDPDTWNYLAVSQVRVTNTEYLIRGTPRFMATGQTNVVFRASLVGTGAFVAIYLDNMFIQCLV